MYSIRHTLITSDNFESITLADVQGNDLQVRKQHVKYVLSNFKGNILHIDMGRMEFTNDIANYIPENIDHIWTLNNTCDDERVHTYPTGVIDLDGELDSEFDSTIFENPNIEKKIDVYLPKNTSFNNIQETIGIECAYTPLKNISTEEHVNNLWSSKMVVCSSSHVIDTCIFWATLMTGGIPIVWGETVRGYGAGWYWKRFRDIIPMINITHPEQLESDYLLREYERIKSEKWNYDFLDASYWIEKILA